MSSTFGQKERMKKLKLQMDQLRVETFTTAGQGGERGTVEGHYGTNHTEQTCVSCAYTCDGWATYEDPEQFCVIC